MKIFSIGKLLISIVALYAAFGSYAFDWNNTHIFNPRWPPHAKFHNAQDMLLGTATGLLAVYIIWVQKSEGRYRLWLSTALAGVYWITQFGAIFFPGTKLMDPEFSHPSQPPAQLIVDIIMVVLLTFAYIIELNRITKQEIYEREH
jgi:hypothetical protein